MTSVALSIGVSQYLKAAPLPATTKDSKEVAKLLAYNDDKSKNMSVTLCNEESTGISKAVLEEQIKRVLSSAATRVLIYFSGHGDLTPGGTAGKLMASDGAIDMRDLMDDIKRFNHKNRSTIVVLDCCHAGAMAMSDAATVPSVELARGVTILAAADTTQNAVENKQNGKFTRLLLDGLRGGSADLAGRVTPASLYTHIDQAIGFTGQRPVFATNIHSSTVVRECTKPIDISILRSMYPLFSNAEAMLQLDPTYEQNRGREFNEPVDNYPDKPLLKDIAFDKDKGKTFSDLQKMVRVGLVKPVMDDSDPADKNHMFWAAVYGRHCALTELGKHYWKLAKDKEI